MWKAQLSDGAAGVSGAAARTEATMDVKSPHAKIGVLTFTDDFLAGALGKAGPLAREVASE